MNKQQQQILIWTVRADLKVSKASTQNLPECQRLELRSSRLAKQTATTFNVQKAWR